MIRPVMPPQPTITIERETAPTDDVRLLIGELDAELGAAYAPEQRHGLNLSRLFQPHVAFFVARLAGEPAGCGAVSFDVPGEHGLAEVKRMYVRPAARGRGIAALILARLADEARELGGVTHLVLETGDAQHAAIRLYGRAGFTRRGAFGPYAQMPREAVGRCVFFEKRIG